MGKHSGIFESYLDHSFSAIFAFSELNFYGILINKDSNDSHSFQFFWAIWLMWGRIYLTKDKENISLFEIMQKFTNQN